MQISNEKRREVANQLRVLSKGILFGRDYCLRADVERAIGIYEPDADVCYAGDVMRLAALIDRPTTSIDVDERGRSCCANCGCDDWGLAPDGNARYCPACGAEVVE